jgi:hypothetical protein
VISRYLVIALAFGASIYRYSQGAWVEGTGLACLAAGLLILRLATTRPEIRPLAYFAFVVTAIAIGVVLYRG